MSRRYRARRRGWRRNSDSVPLLLVDQDGSATGEVFAVLARAVYRYRSELAPFAAAARAALAGLWLHSEHPSAWPLLLAGSVVLAAVVVVWPRPLPVLVRRAERVYAAVLVAFGGGWLCAATAVGPATRPLPALLALGTAVGAVPWWAHHRRRARVRVERTLEAWPDVADAVGLAGARILSAVVDRWGFAARLALRRGQTTQQVRDHLPAIEAGLATRPGAVRVEPDASRADRVVLRVVERDPHAEPIPWPGAPADMSITRPVPLGVFEDGTPATVLLLRRNGLVGGVVGSGKSGVLNVILATLTACPDAEIWGVDLKGGTELRPWAGCLRRLATTPADAVALLRDAVAELDERNARMADDGQRVWDPTADTPALLVLVDEYAELPEDAHQFADSLARRGRAVAVNLLAATQRPTQNAMGRGAVRSQMDVRVCLRVRERRDTDLILGQGMHTTGWHAHTLDQPGKFLLSDPEHPTPRRARAYWLPDNEVSAAAARAKRTGEHVPQVNYEPNPDVALWAALRAAPDGGASVGDLMTASGMSRPSVYRRLQAWARAGRAVQTTRGYWRAVEDR